MSASGKENLVITFVTTSTSRWGAEASMLEIASQIAQHGDASCVLVTASDALGAEWRERVGPEVVTVSRHRTRVRQLLSFVLPMWRCKHGYLVAFDLYVLPLFLILRLTSRRRPRLVIDLHNVLSSPRGIRRLRRAARVADGAIAVSEYAARQISDICATSVVHRAIARPAVVNTQGGRPRRFALVGRVDPDKKLELVAQSAAEMPGDTVILLRGGPSSGNESYADSIRSMFKDAVGSRFIDDGHVPPGRVLDGMDVLIFPNDREPSGRVVVEAQAAGIPVIGPDGGGAAEFIEEGVTGWKFASASSRDLLRVWRLSYDQDLRDMRARCATTAQQLYEPRAQAHAYFNALKGVSDR